jgi:hypothetical protein
MPPLSVRSPILLTILLNVVFGNAFVNMSAGFSVPVTSRNSGSGVSSPGGPEEGRVQGDRESEIGVGDKYLADENFGFNLRGLRPFAFPRSRISEIGVDRR